MPSVTLNEPGLERLFVSEPIQHYLAEGGQKIADAAERQLSAIVHARFQPEVAFSVLTDAEGLRLEIGMKSDSDTAKRLAAKLGRIDEAESWIAFARRAFA